MSTYAPRDRVEVYDEGAWRPGRITHVGPTETSGMGPIVLPGLAEHWCRVLVDRSAAGPGYTIQAPTNDPTVLRPEPVAEPVQPDADGGYPFPDRPRREEPTDPARSRRGARAERERAEATAPAAPSMPLALDEAAVFRALVGTNVMIATGKDYGPMSRPSIERVAADLAAAGIVENEAQAAARRKRNAEIAEDMVAAMAAAERLRAALLDPHGVRTAAVKLRDMTATLAPEVLADLRTVLDHVAPPTEPEEG